MTKLFRSWDQLSSGERFDIMHSENPPTMQQAHQSLFRPTEDGWECARREDLAPEMIQDREGAQCGSAETPSKPHVWVLFSHIHDLEEKFEGVFSEKSKVIEFLEVRRGLYPNSDSIRVGEECVWWTSWRAERVKLNEVP